jgi:ribosome maturation factor RimP
LTQVQTKEKQLEREISRQVETGLPGVEVLAVELTGPARFTVYVDRPEGVDHALCERVTNQLRGYLAEYAVEVSSPGFERPLRKPAHFRNVLGRRVALRTRSRRRLRGEVVHAGGQTVTVRTGDEAVEVPYEEILRGNLIDERVR